MRTVRLPPGFKNWGEYEDRYGVDVLLDVNVMRCRKCRTEWGIEHNRGRMLQRMHRCPQGCNGKPRETNRYLGKPAIEHPMTFEELAQFAGVDVAEEAFEAERRHQQAAAKERWRLGRRRRRAAKVWWTVNHEVDPERWRELGRMFERAANAPDPLAVLPDDSSFLNVLDAQEW